MQFEVSKAFSRSPLVLSKIYKGILNFNFNVDFSETTSILIQE